MKLAYQNFIHWAIFPVLSNIVFFFVLFSCIYLLIVSKFVFGDRATQHGKYREVHSLLILCGHSGLGSGTLTIELSHWSNTVLKGGIVSR